MKDSDPDVGGLCGCVLILGFALLLLAAAVTIIHFVCKLW